MKVSEKADGKRKEKNGIVLKKIDKKCLRWEKNAF